MERKNETGINETAERALVITRILNAPRKLVWQAWTEPEHFKRWWGPKDFTAPICEIDLKVGGRYFNCMRSSEGQEFYSTGTYREIVPMERLVYTDSFADENGNAVSATHYGFSADFPLEMMVIMTLEDFQGKTKMTLKHVGLPPGEMKDMTGTGWNESFDKLAESLHAEAEN